MDGLLTYLSQLIGNNPYFAPILAFVAGVLTSFTPCALSSIPLVVGYVGSTGKESPKSALLLSITFAIGSAITFTTLGVVATTAGSLIGSSASWWYIALGILMVLMALQTWGIYQIIPSSYLIAKNTKKGYLGALLSGVLGGIFSSPCATPVLIVLLAIVAGQGSLPFGVTLLLLYSIGHGMFAVLAGTSMGLVKKLSHSQRYGKISQVLNILTGAVILCLGFYMFYLGF